MPTIKRLKSVTHSIAHHAVSALSYLHPHIGKACFTDGISEIKIDLLANEPCPENWMNDKALRLSINELRTTLIKILNSESWNIDDLEQCTMKFEFNESRPDNWCSTCCANIKCKSGKTCTYSVDWLGNNINIT